MAKLLMISGYGATNISEKGAFYQTLEEFRKHWERIDILCPRGSEAGGTKEFFGNVFVHQSPWPLVCQPWFIAKKGAELYRKHGFDLVTCHEYPPFYNGWGASKLYKRLGISAVLEIMHIPGYPKAANIKEMFYRFLARRILPLTSRWVKGIRVINEHETPDFLVAAGIERKKIFYAPAFYIDLATFRPVETEKKYDCIFVGRLATNKGIDLFIDAVAAAGVRALIVGDGPLRQHVQSRIEVENLQNTVAMHGWAQDSREIATLLNRSRILVMPSLNEGGPRVVLEALACGVPVVATPVGIVPDVLAGQKGGVQVLWDVKEMTDAIKGILGNPSRYAQMAAEGPRIAERFERSAAIANYASALQRFL